MGHQRTFEDISTGTPEVLTLLNSDTTSVYASKTNALCKNTLTAKTLCK